MEIAIAVAGVVLVAFLVVALSGDPLGRRLGPAVTAKGDRALDAAADVKKA